MKNIPIEIILMVLTCVITIMSSFIRKDIKKIDDIKLRNRLDLYSLIIYGCVLASFLSGTIVNILY